MQIEVRKSEAKVEREYPYIGLCGNLRVLFYKENKGTSFDDEEVISVYTTFKESDFTPIAKVKKLIIETE